jgi:hypothetical protein
MYTIIYTYNIGTSNILTIILFFLFKFYYYTLFKTVHGNNIVADNQN